MPQTMCPHAKNHVSLCQKPCVHMRIGDEHATGGMKHITPEEAEERQRRHRLEREQVIIRSMMRPSDEKVREFLNSRGSKWLQNNVPAPNQEGAFDTYASDSAFLLDESEGIACVLMVTCMCPDGNMHVC